MYDRRRCAALFHDDDRAVSELVGFVLVFGIILSSVALLSVTGFQAMEDYQEVEQQRNAQRAMTALADNFNDVARHDGIDRRYGELSLRGGTISTNADGPTVYINLTSSANSGALSEYDTGGDPELEFELGAFEYEAESTAISYQGGAVVHKQGELFIREPLVRYNEDTNVAVISLVKIDGTGRSIQSSGGQGVTISVDDRTSELYNTDDIDTIESDDEPWSGELAELDGSIDDSADVDRVLVTIVEADVEY